LFKVNLNQTFLHEIYEFKAIQLYCGFWADIDMSFIFLICQPKTCFTARTICSNYQSQTCKF